MWLRCPRSTHRSENNPPTPAGEIYGAGALARLTPAPCPSPMDLVLPSASPPLAPRRSLGVPAAGSPLPRGRRGSGVGRALFPSLPPAQRAPCPAVPGREPGAGSGQCRLSGDSWEGWDSCGTHKSPPGAGPPRESGPSAGGQHLRTPGTPGSAGMLWGDQDSPEPTARPPPPLQAETLQTHDTQSSRGSSSSWVFAGASVTFWGQGCKGQVPGTEASPLHPAASLTPLGSPQKPI